MTLCIHLGAHKTATTHLQTAFDRAAPRLAGQGIGWLGPRQLRAAPADLRHLLDDPQAMPWKARRAAEVLQQARDGHDRLVLSDELILGDTRPDRLFTSSGRLYPQAARRLANLIALVDGPPVTLFLSLRAPGDFLISAFGEELRTGRQALLPEFLSGLRAAKLRWTDLGARLLALEGVAGLVCWRYEDLSMLRPAVLRHLVGPEAASLIPDPAPRRIGWSAAAYAAYLAELPQNVDAQGRREIARRAMKAHPRGLGDAGLQAAIPADQLPKPGHYDSDCADLAAQAGVTFLRPSGAF